MTIYSQIIEKVLLPINDKILGLSFCQELNKWRDIQWLNGSKLQEMQYEGLKNILNHSVQNIPYYKNLVLKSEFENKNNPVETLKNFPFLTKKIIRGNYSKILDKTRKTYFVDYTSGSSGIQGQFNSDKSAFSTAHAIHAFWKEWSGYRFGDRIFQTGMTVNRGFLKRIKDILLRVKYTQAYEMDTKLILNNLKSIIGSKDYYFLGYASSLYTYARVAHENGIDDIDFKAVISWGDKMFPHYRSLIESQFRTEVFSTYAANENTMIATECQEHNYHIMIPHIYLEILDDDGNEVKPGEIGEVVVTRLDNYLMPLIRYKMGDLAVKADPEKKCKCGREFPILEEIIGRDTDIVHTPGGKVLIVHFFTGIFEYYKEIEQFQVVQKNTGPLEIRYIPDMNFNESVLDKIKDEMYEKANEKFPFKYVRVDEIKPSSSGKPQIVVQE